MKQRNIQQEVLVVTQTSFAQNVIIGQQVSDNKYFLADKLERGFWDGMLNKVLPELTGPMQGRQPGLSIWQIRVGEFLLLIDMAETPEIIEDLYSINPSCLLSMVKMN